MNRKGEKIMNQEKIGRFIAKCRKTKKITQSELAEKLGVTDRSVSNWENGKNMPDLSLFKPLCETLNITINELLSGEKINKNDYQEKLEENIINTINYSNKKLEQKNHFIGLILLLFGFFISLLGLIAFNPDSHVCSFSIVIGMMFGTIGFYKLIKTSSYFKNLICLLFFFIGYWGMILFFDYIGVAYNKRPPIFSTTITTIMTRYIMILFSMMW
jgi:transcriptional regulator with XRE-family HTH domain